MKRLRLINIIILIAFAANSLGPLPLVHGQELVLPNPGQMLHLSNKFTPPEIRGLKVFPDNPFRFDFILEKGDRHFTNAQLTDESTQLIRYFLASLTVPEKDLWVNLSPYEKNRIVPDAFGVTDMGRDLLAQDYLLKQLTASLLYPEDEIGAKFWNRMKDLAKQKFGTNEIPTNTFNKVWVVPEKAVVYENAKAGTAYIVESHLKVMLEEDYVALAHQNDREESPTTTRDLTLEKNTNSVGSQIVRELIIPELTKEINENEHFAKLRQIYNSFILATWYKQKIKNSILNKVYADKNKVTGVNIDDPLEKQKIYERYLEAFKKGAYNYIKEEYDPASQEMIPRKYFSGGFQLSNVITYTNVPPAISASSALISTNLMPLNPLYFGPERANDSDFGALDDSPEKKATTGTSDLAYEDIKTTMDELGLNYSQAATLLENFTVRSKVFSELLNKTVTLKITSNKEAHHDMTLPGIMFSYRVDASEGNPGSVIGRFKINRKDTDTLMLSGLYSRDTSQAGEEVPIIVPYINFDYNRTETIIGFSEFEYMLRKKFFVLAFNALLYTDLGEERYAPILKKLYGEEFYAAVEDGVITSGKEFNVVLNKLLGGADYKEVPVVIKVLARAAAGLTKNQIMGAQITTPYNQYNLDDVLKIFDSMPRKYSPSQKFPPKQEIVESLFAGARFLQKQSQEWNLSLELEVAMPDGLQNYVLYHRLMGFQLVNPSPYVQKLITDFEARQAEDKRQVREMSVEQKAAARAQGIKLGKGVVDIVWELLRENNFRHELATMVFGDEDFGTNFSVTDVVNSLLGYFENAIFDNRGNEVYTALRAISEPHRLEIEKTLGQKITLFILPHQEFINGKKLPGAIISYSAAGDLVWRWKLNWDGDDLWISGLFIRDIKQPGDVVPIIANYINFDYDREETLLGFNDFNNLLEQQVGRASYAQVMGIDNLGLPQYKAALTGLLGEAVYAELERKAQEPGNSFNAALQQRLGGDAYKEFNVVLKVLALAGVGLTQSQIEQLPIDNITDLSRLIELLQTSRRKFTPSQKYPSDPAFQGLLKDNAEQLKTLAYAWGYKNIKLQVAIPDGLTNLETYKRMGYIPKNIEANEFVQDRLNEFREIREQYKREGRKLSLVDIVWKILRFNHLEHQLLTLSLDVEAAHAAISVPKVAPRIDLNQPEFREKVEEIFSAYIPTLEAALGQKVQMTITENEHELRGRALPGFRVTLTVPKTTANGQAERFKVANLSLNGSDETLLISELFFNDPNANANAKALIISNDIDYDDSEILTRQAFQEFESALKAKLGSARFDALLREDLGSKRYGQTLSKLLGKKYTEPLADYEALGAQENKTFQDYLNFELGAYAYSNLNTVLKVLAAAGVGLTKEQIDNLAIAPDAGLNEIINALQAQPRLYYPTQRLPSSTAFQDMLKGISKEIPPFAKAAGFKNIQYIISLPDALQNLLLYLTLGYNVNPRNSPVLTAIVQEFMSKRNEIPDLQKMAWHLYNGVERFRGIHRLVPMVYDLTTDDSPSSIKGKLAAIGNMPLPKGYENLVASTPVGGIDFDPEQLILITQNSNGEIEFNVDPLVLQQLQNVPGFTPIILNIQPIQNFQAFLGTNPAAN